MKLNKLLAYLGCFGNKCLGDPTRRPISTWGVRWGASRADGVISILIYVSRLLAATHLQYCPQPVNKYRSAKKHTPQMQAPLPKQGPGPSPLLLTARPPPPESRVGSSGFSKPPTHHLQPPPQQETYSVRSTPQPSLQEISSPYAFSLPAGNLLPPPPFYIHAPPLLLPKRPPQPETY